MHTIRKLSENSPWNREKVGVHCVDQILKDLRSHHTARVEKQVPQSGRGLSEVGS